MTDTTLNAFVASGTRAERLAFTPSPPTPATGNAFGYTWHETDTTNTYAWNSVTPGWDLVGALAPVAFAGLPASPVKGWRGFVTDSTTATFGATIAGGGSDEVPATYNGTVWIVG